MRSVPDPKIQVYNHCHTS